MVGTHYRNHFSNLHDAQGLRERGGKPPLPLSSVYPICKDMVKIKSIAILCIFLSNLALSVKYGFNSLTIITLLLAAIVLLWDIIEEVQHGRKK